MSVKDDDPVAIVNLTALTMDDLTKVPTKALTRAVDKRWDAMWLWAVKASTLLHLLVETGAVTPAMRETIKNTILKDDPTA